jgi:hypothetical protein
VSNISILGPRGTPMVELGGERAWRQRVIGDVVCSYQWIDLRAAGDPKGEEWPEPCMVLFPAFRRMEAGAYTIPQRNAFAYVDRKGNPTPQLLKTCALAAETLGFDMNDRASIRRMIDIICEGIPDLIDMPSDQPSALEVQKHRMGIEVSARASGRELHTEVI